MGRPLPSIDTLLVKSLYEHPHFVSSLLESGYPLDNERLIEDAAILYQIARVVRGVSLVVGPGRRAKRVGRNEPCPCGSGKKFKRCCLKHGPEPVPANCQLDSREPPYALPNLWDDDALTDDINELIRTLIRHDELRLFVPDPRQIDDLVVDYPELEQPDLDPDRIDAIAERFVDEWYEWYEYEELAQACVDVARKSDPGGSTARVCTLGAYLAKLAAEAKDPVSMVGIATFRAGLSQYATRLAAYRQLAPRAADDAEPSAFEQRVAKHLAEDPDLIDEIHDRLTIELLEADLDVPLPLASLLLFRTPDDTPQDAEVSTGGFEEAVEQLGPEDLRLIDEYMERTLGDEGHGPLARSRIALLRARLRDDADRVTLRALASSSVAAREFAELWFRDTHAILDTDKPWRRPGPLERYADSLEQRGYPELATRTRAYIVALAGAVKTD